VASELPLGGQNPISLVMSLASARELREGSNPESGYNGLRVAIESGADPDSVSRAIRAVTGNRPNLFVVDVREQAEDQRSITVQLSILLYGLVAVIALIGGLNIVNTITTNVLIRVREFGILRAVGMSRSQMRRMIRLESFLYGSWAVLGGGIVGVALTRIIFSNVNQVQSIPWRLPLPSLGISFAAAVAICLISAVPPLRRVENLSIVDSIRSRQ
jgi:putative ABC transport system permease protein